MRKPNERKKAAFIAAYRALCEEHGMMVIKVENPGEYWPFCVAVLDPPCMGAFVQEMLIERVRTISMA